MSNDSALSSVMINSPSMSSANQIPLSALVEYSMAERSFMQGKLIDFYIYCVFFMCKHLLRVVV